MHSPADATTSAGGSRVEMIDRLRVRLEQVADLSTRMRTALRRADAPAIDRATSRLETLALEFKLLHDELMRVPADDDGTAETASEREARARLIDATTALTRSAAVHGGLLERLVTMSNGLVGLIQTTRGTPYGADGRAGDMTGEGIHLREQA